MEASNKDFEVKFRAILGPNGAYAENDSIAAEVAMEVSVQVLGVEGDLAIVRLCPIVRSKKVLSVQDKKMMDRVEIVAMTENERGEERVVVCNGSMGKEGAR